MTLSNVARSMGYPPAFVELLALLPAPGTAMDRDLAAAWGRAAEGVIMLTFGHQPPHLPAVSKVLQTIEKKRTVVAVDQAKPTGVKRPLPTKLQAAIGEAVRRLSGQKPEGVAIQEIADHLSVKYNTVKQAIDAVAQRGLVKTDRGGRNGSFRVFPASVESVPISLTDNQRAILNTMIALRDGVTVTATMRRLCVLAGVSMSSIYDQILALCQKGLIKQISRGSGTESNVYELLPAAFEGEKNV